jgi:two-component system, OmpR family, sensor histidine kinase MprB
MSLRSRLALAFAVLATVVAGLMGLLGYTATTNQLERAADQALLNDRGGRPGHDEPGDRDDQPSVLISATGAVLQTEGSVQLPVTEQDKQAAASSQSQAYARTQSVNGVPYRIVTVAPGDGQGALLRGRDFSESQMVLNQLAIILTVSAAGLALIAAVLGWFLATQITKRLVRLTNAAETVSLTGDLDVEVPSAGRDEVGRLSGAFTTMLGRLAQSQSEQTRLVQDAGHELRTPLTSLRTNISLLERFDDLSPEIRTRVLADLKGESRELTGLVNEVLALAGGQAFAGDVEPLRLADIAESVADRARRRTGREVIVNADDTVVEARRGAIERAIWNLVDNAAKFDASGSPIEIEVRDGTVDVLDRGPGVSADDAAHIFDRFFRPVASRSLPGSGLGLSIVKDVAESAGGTVHAHDRPGGGMIIGMAFPQKPA